MNSRRLHVVILIILLILITSMGVYFFIASSVFRPSLPSRISTEDYSDYVCSGLAQGTVRGDMSLVASSDKLLQLSTCVLPADDEARFIVSAVYVGEDPL